MALLLTVATGAWAQDPDPIDLTPSADGTVWTLSTMPAYDVELEVTYKTDLTLTVSLSGWTYGATANTPTVTGNTGNGAVTYNYKKKDADDETYSADVPTDAGIYTIRATVAETDDYADGVATADFTIAAADIAAIDITAPTANTLNFTGQAQALIEAGSVSGGIGTMQYSLDGTNWSTDIPTGTDEGDYTVYYKVVGDDNHNDVAAQSFKVTIGAALPIDLTSTDGKEWTYDQPAYDVELEVEYYPAATLTTAPTGIDVYATGADQALVSGGVVNGGTLHYALGTDNQTAPTTGWSADVPTKTAPGTYYVWYKVIGDDEHSDGEDAPDYVTAKINGFPVTVAPGEYVTYYSDMALKANDANVKLYSVTDVSETAATITELSVAAAETPLLVYNGSTEATVILIPTNDAADNVTPAKEFVGTLTGENITSTSSYDYYAFNGLDFVYVTNTVNIPAGKCYIAIPTGGWAARSITLVNNSPTAIEATLMNNEEMNNDEWYDLNGRKVNKPTKKGVFINNGRKVVIK